MSGTGDLLLNLFRDAWGALVGALVAFALLALLSQTLKSASGMALGAQDWVRDAVAGGIGVLALTLFALLGVPALVDAANASFPNSAGCGPITELGSLAVRLLGGLGALRMLKATVTAVMSAAVGGQGSLSAALLEAGEVVLGMVVASIAVPIAIHFFGLCSDPLPPGVACLIN